MNKFIRIILAAFLAILSLGLAGCVGSKDEVPSETSTSPSNSSTDSTIYEQYLRKVWIEKNWDGGDIFYPIPFSLSITDIKEEKIEGKFSIDTVADSDYLLGGFTGAIQNGKVNCQFDDKSGNKGNMTLDFLENNKLEVSIEFTEKDPIYRAENGTYLFRLYNLKDVEKSLDAIKTYSIAINLFWGNVNIVAVVYNVDKSPCPVVFLANDDGDILYRFGGAFPNGTEIKDILIEDINGDGLEDVIFISAPPHADIYSDLDAVHFEDIYLQNEKGLFEFSERIEKANTER